MLNDIQQQIVETKEPKVAVISAPASGKTHCITERIKFLLESGVDPTKIVAITFTKAAAEEMSDRLKEVNSNGVFIGTVHAYANYLLIKNGIDTSQYLNDEEERFDELFDEIVKHKNCIEEVEHMIIDEAQDTDEKQFDFLITLVKPKNWMLIGDYRQCIYEWRGVDPRLMQKVVLREKPKVFSMNKNYRNAKSISEFARSIIFRLGYEYNDTSEIMSMKDGSVYVMDYDLNAIPDIVYSDRIYKNWFIICRTNMEVQKVCGILDKFKIPNSTFKRGGISSEELKEKLSKDSVKVITVHTAKGLENKNVVVIGVNPAPKDEEVRVNYVAATRAKDNLFWMPLFRKRKQRNSKVTSWE